MPWLVLSMAMTLMDITLCILSPYIIEVRFSPIIAHAHTFVGDWLVSVLCWISGVITYTDSLRLVRLMCNVRASALLKIALRRTKLSRLSLLFRHHGQALSAWICSVRHALSANPDRPTSPNLTPPLTLFGHGYSSINSVRGFSTATITVHQQYIPCVVKH